MLKRLLFAMNLNKILPHLIYQFKSETELITNIQKVSENFTTKRENLRDYLKSEKLISAYTAFYLTTNLPKWNEVLNKISLSKEELADFEVIDIGTGPGTFMLAALDDNPQQVIYGFESAELMRNQGNKLIKNLFPGTNAQIYSHLNAIGEKRKKRLGVFGHSANEMEVHQVLKLIKSLELDKVLFIEPGTSTYFAKALDIRSELLKLDFKISYPCASQKTCPMSSGDDWCHQFLYIKQAPDVERLCQILKKDRKLLPQTIHFFEKEQTQTNEELSRIIRVYKPTKFGLEMQVCQSRAGENYLFDIQQLSRHRSKKEMKELSKILAGDKVSFEIVKELERGKLRVDITRE